MLSGGWPSGLFASAIVTIVVLFFAACSPSGQASGSVISGAPTGSAADQPDPGCAVQQQPGPGDGPAAGGEIDTTGQGPGRWRICVMSSAPATVEGSAWCKWNADRTAVDEVSGLPIPTGSVDYDAWLSFTASKFEVHLTDTAHGGLIANYVPRQQVVPATDSTHTAGTAAFDVALQVDPGSGPPVGAPPTVTGMIAWVCGDPRTAS